jgi:tetratricopeptide (TPR) repeat protein
MSRKKIWLLLLLCALAAVLSACSSPPSTAYNNALELFASGDYEGAAPVFEKLGDYQQAELYAAYSYGLTLYEAGSFVEAEPYFAACRGFMLGESRYQFCHGCLRFLRHTHLVDQTGRQGFIVEALARYLRGVDGKHRIGNIHIHDLCSITEGFNRHISVQG